MGERSIEDSFHIHAQMTENKEYSDSGGDGGSEEDFFTNTKAVNRKIIWSSNFHISALPSPRSSRVVWRVMICSEMMCQTSLQMTMTSLTIIFQLSPWPLEPKGALGPGVHMNFSAPAEGQSVLKTKSAEARIWNWINVLRSTIVVTASFRIFFFFLVRWVKICVFYFKDSLVIGFPQRNSEIFAISY